MEYNRIAHKIIYKMNDSLLLFGIEPQNNTQVNYLYVKRFFTRNKTKRHVIDELLVNLLQYPGCHLTNN
jgi:hypothetical protein